MASPVEAAGGRNPQTIFDNIAIQTDGEGGGGGSSVEIPPPSVAAPVALSVDGPLTMPVRYTDRQSRNSIVITLLMTTSERHAQLEPIYHICAKNYFL